jgi:hypothetical protein
MPILAVTEREREGRAPPALAAAAARNSFGNNEETAVTEPSNQA